jgi:hypoxanthine phosphoribosyltransferase
MERWRLRPSWSTYYKCLAAKQVIEPIRDFKPNVIIGVNNGIVAASIIATNFAVEDLVHYHVFPEVDDYGCRRDPSFHELKMDLAGKRILIVDDQLFTGRTMDAVYRFVLSQKGVDRKNVYRFALFCSQLGSERLEIPSFGRLRGAIRRVPWSFTKEHKEKTQHASPSFNQQGSGNVKG